MPSSVKLVRALKSIASWSQRHVPATLQRWAAHLESQPIGRRFQQRQGLGWMQRWYAAQPTQRVVISVLELSAPVTRDMVEIAVRGLCARHPSALGICEVRARTRLEIRRLTAADRVPWFESKPRDVWPLAAALVHSTFATGAPLFRIALDADRRHIVAAFDHLIADGVSAGIFAAELGAFLAGDALMPAPDDALLPLDARIDLRPSLPVLARSFHGHALTQMLLAPEVSNGADPAPHPLRTGLSAQKFPRDLTDALVARARQQSLSLHAVLSAAAMLAALEALDGNRAWLRLTTPISLRDRCRPVPSGIGVFIASVDTDLELSMTDDLWLIAARCRDDLSRQRPDAQRSVGLLAFAGDLEALALKQERTANGRTATVEVSNVGRVIGVPMGAAIWLTQGAHYHAALFVLTVATSDSDGALRCCLSYPKPLLDDLRAHRFMRALEQNLELMSEGSITGVAPIEA
jgi:hypothetical protein